MAKFCTKCGKPLEEGKICNCGIKSETDALEQTKTIARNYANIFLEIIKEIMKNPIDTMKKHATEKNFGFGIVVILLNAIASGLLLYCFLKEGIDKLGYGILMMRADVSFMNTLMIGIVFVLVGFIVTIAMICALTNLFKSKINYKTVTALTGTCSIFMTVATLISTLVLFISIDFATIILFVASLFYLTFLCQGIMEITTLSKNKLAYVFVPTVSVTLFVVVYILPEFLF